MDIWKTHVGKGQTGQRPAQALCGGGGGTWESLRNNNEKKKTT